MDGAVNMTRSEQEAGRWGIVLAGLAASLVGVGLARFAYTPLLPAVIAAGWFPPGQAAYLGAANLAGYLAGALAAGTVAARLAPATVLRPAMLVAALSFVACAWPASFAWFFLWRFAAGAAGGLLMVVAASAVIGQVAPHRRGLAAGVVFMGVGLGIAASGTLMPILLRQGLSAAWLGLGAVSLALACWTWRRWPQASPAAVEPRRPPGRAWRAHGALWPLYLCYGLNAIGLVPHMVFLGDVIARGMGRGLDQAALFWVLFGVGAVAGPPLAGRVGDRIGFRAAFRLALAVQAAAVILPAVSGATASLTVSSLVIGAMVPGVVPLVLGRVQEATATALWRRTPAWGAATLAFAIGQAVAGYGFALLYAHAGGHAPMFALAAAALVIALTIDMATGRTAAAPPANITETRP